jgi:SOS-response transcriptional repressor LexA
VKGRASKALGVRLRQIRLLLSMTQTELARALGQSSQGYIAGIEAGLKGPSAGMLSGLEHLGFSGRWLMTGEGAIQLPGQPMPPGAGGPPINTAVMSRDRPPSLPGARQIPLVGGVAAGLDHPIPEDVIERLIPVHLGEHADHQCFASRVTGHSMEPMFYAGDVIIIDKTCAPENNDVAVVAWDDQVLLKRVSMDDRHVYLLSINQVVPPIRVSRSNPDARIVGRVIQLLRTKF